MYMIDNNSISDFRSAMLRPGPGRRPETREFFSRGGRHITNLNDIKDACYAVYEAGVPFRKQGKEAQNYKGPAPGGELNYGSALDALAKKIYNFFNNKPNTPNTQANFDKFHAELCKGFRDSANADRRSKGLFDDLTYGNAQKLVNMTFKYLTTFEDYPAFSDLFEHFHMPIDRKILRYFAHIGIPNCSKSGEYNSIPWTKITSPALYKQLVSDYQRILSKRYPNFTMLHLEYYFWDAMNRDTFTIAPVPSSPLPGTKTAFYM